MDSSLEQEDNKWIRMEDLDTVMESNPSYKDIIFSDGETKLVDYISSMENVKTLHSLLQTIDVNMSLPNDSPLWPGCTLLHLTVLFCEKLKDSDKFGKFHAAKIISLLLDEDASVQAQNSRGMSSVHLAFRLDQPKTMFLLMRKLEKNPDEVLNLMDDEDLSHLHIFCTISDNRKSLARKLLEQKSIKSTISITFKGEDLPKVKKGWTPLHVALDQAQITLIEMLLKGGAKKICPDARGCTPIHKLFGAAGMKSVADVLFASDDLIESVDEVTGLTHLHIAVWFNDIKSVEKLLDLGANINAAMGTYTTKKLRKFSGATPLTMAMIMDQSKIMSLLLNRGADILARNPDGPSALSTALTRFEFMDTKKILNLINTDQNLQQRMTDELGLTMLHIACFNDDANQVEELLKNGTDPNVRVHENSNFWMGYTPLHLFVASNSYDLNQTTRTILEKLLQSDCDIDLQDGQGKTALHKAVEVGNNEIVRELLYAGADINILDYEGKSVISYVLELSLPENEWRLVGNDKIIQNLVLHIHKMKLIGMEMNELCDILKTTALQKCSLELKFDNESAFCDQVRETENIKIGWRGLSLRSFLSETGAISLYPSLMSTDHDEVAAFFQSLDEQKFPDLSSWLRRQYRKAVARLSLMTFASNALKTFMCANFPDQCVDIILKYLSNSQLRQLITAASIGNTVA